MAERYELVETVADGPIFRSYRAHDLETLTEVRIRVLKGAAATESDFTDALAEAVERGRRVGHRNLEQVELKRDEEGAVFLVSTLRMESPLAERLEAVELYSPLVSVEIGVQLLSALVALHSAGIVHGDVRPENILLESESDVVLCLPGLYMAYPYSGTIGLALVDHVAPFLAPEVAGGGMPTPRSDIYAAACVIYRVVTGRMPYPGDSPSAIARKHATAPYPTMRLWNPAIPRELDEILRKAMSKEPERRYRDAGEMLTDLQALRDSLRFGRPIPAINRTRAPAAVMVSPSKDIAPKMNAARLRKVEERRERQAAAEVPDPARVPAWLTLSATLMAAMAVASIAGWIYFNLTKAGLVQVPNVVGMTEAEANTRLEQMDLGLRVIRRESSDEHPEGTIIQVMPAPGLDVRENTDVSVVVSSGSRFVQVPELIGMDVNEAKRMLEQVGLRLKEPVEWIADGSQPRGHIVSQYPKNDSTVERYAMISVEVSTSDPLRQRPEREDEDLEDGVDAEALLYTVTITMPTEGEAPILVRVDMEDNRGVRTIYEEEHLSGDEFRVQHEGVGESATFRIYFDGELRKEQTFRADGVD